MASEGWSVQWGVGSTKPCSLSHRQSTLSLRDMKETAAFRVPRELSYRLTTGDSERARICIHFASHLHRTAACLARASCSSSLGVTVGGLLHALCSGEEEGSQQGRQGPYPGLQGQRLAPLRSSGPWKTASGQEVLFFWGVILSLKPRAHCANEVALVA